MTKVCAALLLAFCTFAAQAQIAETPPAKKEVVAESQFLGAYPSLKDYLFREPKSGFYLGLGVSPVAVLGERMMFTANFFELHWIKDNWDIEWLKASYGFTRAQTSRLQSSHFTLRAAPKYRLFGQVSLGPLLGYESVTFPGVKAVIYNNGLNTDRQPFSNRGWIYGAVCSQNIVTEKGYVFKLNESVYRETYSTDRTPNNWKYVFMDSDLQADRKKIEAALVYMIEVSFLF